MPRFSYIARTKQGKREIGIIDTSSEDEVVSRLQSRGLIVTRVTAEGLKAPSAKRGVSLPTRRFTHKKVKLYDLVFFARQLSTLLDSGITIHKSMDALSKQVSSSSLYNIVSQTKKDIEGGSTLKDALAKHPKVFSEFWVNLVESGEASGNLALVLDRLAKYLEMQANFRRKIVSALIYPAILFIVAMGAVAFFLMKIVPTFANLFKGFGVELPFITQLLLNFSGILTKGFIPGVAILFGVYFIYKQAIKTDTGKYAVDKFKIQLPVFGNFFKVLAVDRFTSEMATLIEGGVPILYALEITERSVGNKILEGVIKDIKVSVREGKGMAELFSKSDFFEPMVVQMIAIGEEVGELAKMFKRIATFYDEYLETFVARFATIFEPVMLVFMGGIIGTMVVALFLPVFSIVSIARGL